MSFNIALSGQTQDNIVSIGTNLSSTNASISNASITSLSVIDFKSATFSPHTINTSNLNVSSINLDPNFVFPVLNVTTLVSQEESFVNVSAVNISANQITADNLQPLLTAGDNISIDANNRISALNNNLPATGNFTTLNTSQINASNISTGDLTFGSNFTLNDKFLTVNSTTNITENSGDLITSGAVYNALNKFSTNISDGRSLTNTKLIAGGDVIKPIVSGTTNVIDVDVDPGTSKNIMKVFYTTKFGADAILGVVANFAYVVSGFGYDKITARLEYNNGSNNNIGQGEQIWADEQGGGTRSGVLSPRIGTRRSAVSVGTTVYFQIIIQNDSNDTFTFLNPDACTFQITESLDNAGSDLNLNTGNLQADEANFNSLTVQAGSGSGQATIGRTYLGNNAFSNMACLSVNGNDGANNYGFAQVANNQTIMNAMPSAYNSFRCENVEVASIGQIGLGIGLGTNNTAVFPLEVSGDTLVSGIMFANEIDTADADITNISNTNLSGTNATFQEINVSGNLIVNGTTFTTTNLTAGENVNISNNVISAFFGSGGQVNLNYIQVDGGVDIGGVLNVSQTSNFSNSVNVGDILYVGEAGNHEGSVVVYSNIVGDNYTTKINSSTLELNCSATGNLSAINFFVGNNKSLEITNSGIEATSITSDSIDTANITADVLTFIDGRATFRFNTPQINASNASIDTADIGQINASVVTCDVLETDELDLNLLNVSTLNFSVGVVDQLDTSIFTARTSNTSKLIISDIQDGDGLIVDSGAYFNEGVFISESLQHTGSDMFLGSPSQEPNGFGGDPRSRINVWGVNPSFVGEIGMRWGIHEDNTAGAKIGSFGGVERYNIEFNGVDSLDLDNVSTTIHNKLNASNISSDKLTADTLTSENDNSTFLKTFHFNLSDQGSLGLATTFERFTDTTITSPVGSIIFNTKPNSTARAMIISQNNIVTTRTINNVGLIETRNFSVDENVSITSSLTANDLEIMNNVDIYNDLFVANRIDATTVDAFDVVGNNGEFGLIDANTINATTINASTINSSNGNFSGIVVNATGSFQNVVANNVNVAGTLNANNIPGYQKELTAGENVSILNDVISVIIEEFPSDANFSSITSQVGNFSTINADTSIVGTANTSFINTSFFSCIDEAGFSGTLNGNIISCNELDSDDIVTTEITATRMIGTNARATSMQTSSLNISDPSTGLATNIVRSGNNTTLSSLAGSIIIDTNPNSTNRAMIIGPDNIIQTRTIQNANLLETRNFSVDENVSVTGSLSVNQLSIDGKNASTASIAFSNDFLFDTFSNTLRLAEDPNQAIQDALEDGIVTTSVNTSNLNVDGLTTLDAVAVSQSINALVANLNTINSSGTANINTINASNIVGYQETITGGLNISVLNDVVSTDANVNFSSVNTSSLTAEGISTFDVVDFRVALYSTNNFLMNINSSGRSNLSSVNVSTFTASTINSSVINGDNLSTASISFDPTDFNFSNGELSLVGGGGGTLPADANFSSITADTGNISELDAFNISATGYITMERFRPNLYFRNTETDSRFGCIQMNDSKFFFLSGPQDSVFFGKTNFEWPLIIDTTNNDARFGGNISVVGAVNSTSCNMSTGNFSTINSQIGNFSTINASSIVGYQETISGGLNTSVLNNVVSTDANVNFSSINSSTITTSGDVIIGDKLDRKQNIVNFKSSDFINLGGVTSFTMNAGNATNVVDFVSHTSGQYTFLKAGLYKVNVHCDVRATFYNNRIQFRVLPFVNGVNDALNPTGYEYIRGGSLTGKSGSLDITFILSLSLNDVMTFVVESGREGVPVFGGDMSGSAVEGQSIIFEYLGS